jgi:hypothetical protein
MGVGVMAQAVEHLPSKYEVKCEFKPQYHHKKREKKKTLTASKRLSGTEVKMKIWSLSSLLLTIDIILPTLE